MPSIFKQTGRSGSTWLPIAALVAVAALLLGPAAAGGQVVSPTAGQYDTLPEQIQDAVGVGVDQPAPDELPADERVPADEAAPPERDRAVAALPFTGLDIALLAAAAALLGLSGLALRRLARTPGDNR